MQLDRLWFGSFVGIALAFLALSAGIAFLPATTPDQEFMVMCSPGVIVKTTAAPWRQVDERPAMVVEVVVYDGPWGDSVPVYPKVIICTKPQED
jgi:hypothetical protein